MKALYLPLTFMLISLSTLGQQPDSCTNGYLYYAQHDTFTHTPRTIPCGMTIAKVWQQRYTISAITTNPNNPNEIAYIKRDNQDNDFSSRLKICTFNFCTSKETCLIEGIYTDLWLEWSSQGQLLFNYNGPVIYSLNTDGTHLNQITFDGDYNFDAKWSPDGTRIFYHKNMGGGQYYNLIHNPTTQQTDSIAALQTIGPFGWKSNHEILARFHDQTPGYIGAYNLLTDSTTFITNQLGDAPLSIGPYFFTPNLDTLFWGDHKHLCRTSISTNTFDTVQTHIKLAELTGFAYAPQNNIVYFTRTDLEEFEWCKDKAWSNIFAFNPATNQTWRLDLGILDTVGEIDTTGYAINTSTTQLAATHLAESVKLYPNPTKGVLHIEVPYHSIQNIKIYNQIGQLVLQKKQTATPQNVTVNTNPLPTGVYILHVSTKDKTHVKTFIKQ